MRNVADYIPQLAGADPDVLGVALTIPNGRTYSVGDDRVEFSIQSISKPFAYAAALIDRGVDAVDATVGVEPSGEAFDELSLEGGTHRPKNPMINAGALAVHHLLAGDGARTQDRVTRIVEFLSGLVGRVLTVDEEVYRSEIETADALRGRTPRDHRRPRGHGRERYHRLRDSGSRPLPRC